MKSASKIFILLVAFAAITATGFAQTPYDNFIPNNKKKEMLKLPDVSFRAYNTDSTKEIRYIDFDKETFVLKCFNKNDSLIKTAFVPPTEYKWWTVDPHANKYPGLSPFSFVGNMPIRAVDPNGQDIYILFYTSGNSRGDEMFKASALTRQNEIQKSKNFDPTKDIVVVLAVQNMASIQYIVNNIVKTLSPQYGQTQEFSIWSHAATDGPTGTVPTSANALDGKQMTIEGWSNIGFNWKNNGAGTNANFFGCNTGVNSTESQVFDGGVGWWGETMEVQNSSFASKISSLSNFNNVSVSGQKSNAYPSMFTNYRINSENGTDNFINYTSNGMIYFQTTYMVGGNASFMGLNSNSSQTVAFPMQLNVNGQTTGTAFQTGKTINP